MNTHALRSNTGTFRKKSQASSAEQAWLNGGWKRFDFRRVWSFNGQRHTLIYVQSFPSVCPKMWKPRRRVAHAAFVGFDEEEFKSGGRSIEWENFPSSGDTSSRSSSGGEIFKLQPQDPAPWWNKFQAPVMQAQDPAPVRKNSTSSGDVQAAKRENSLELQYVKWEFNKPGDASTLRAPVRKMRVQQAPVMPAALRAPVRKMRVQQAPVMQAALRAPVRKMRVQQAPVMQAALELQYVKWEFNKLRWCKCWI